MKRILPPLAIAVLLAAVYGLAAYGKPVRVGAGRQAPAPASVPVSTVVRACASPGTVHTGGFALVATPATAGPGRAVVNRLGSHSSDPLLSVTHPGQLSLHTVTPVHAAPSPSPSPSRGGKSISATSVRGGVVIRASGAMARGLEAEQLGAGSVPSARCESPATDFWFVGPGQQTVSHIQLYLMNVSSRSAVVSAEISTDAGPLQESTDTGIAVAPHSMVTQSLAPALHGSRVIAVHVRTSVGQVVAALEETKDGTHAGEWLPATQPPASTVVVPGVPGTAGTRKLFVAVPGTQDAHVHLTAVTTRGSYQPTGGASLDIPGGSAIGISLPSMAGIPAALKISSNVPVSASAMLPGGPPGAPGAFTATAAPITQQGVVADNQGGVGESSQLVLSAPGHAVKARISKIGTGGTGPAAGAKVVHVRAGHTLVTPLGRLGSHGSSTYSVVITPLPGSGPLYAGRVIQSSTGTVQSVLPVASALTTVPLPSVRHAFITAGR